MTSIEPRLSDAPEDEPEVLPAVVVDQDGEEVTALGRAGPSSPSELVHTIERRAARQRALGWSWCGSLAAGCDE
jgi:hypothetical protein